MTSFHITPGPLAIPFAQACARLEQIGFADALWSRTLSVWTTDPATQAAIASRLGWLSAADVMSPHVARLRALADDCRQAVRTDGLTDVVLLGMGGSSLAPEVLRAVFGEAPGLPRFHVLDSVDPDSVRRAMAQAASSVFILASKSGSTIEPNVMAAEARRRLEAAGLAWGARFIAITDDQTALHRLAIGSAFRDVFVNPGDIGGRFSALSFFGLVPAALMGIDVAALLAAARSMETMCRGVDATANPGLALGALMAAGAQSGRDKLTLLLPGRFAAFSLWVEQLVAESTGKRGVGVVPIAGEPADASFGPDRVVVVVRAGDEQPDAETVARAAAAGAPMAELTLPDAIHLGAEFLRWEVATAAAGVLLGINPFDEPNVQQAKDATRALLDAYRSAGRLPAPAPHASRAGVRFTVSDAAQRHLAGADPSTFLSLAGPGDYVAILAYLPSDDESTGSTLDSFRQALAASTGRPTMLGYGPRYLHSTGQLHKGGANNGVFLMLTAAPDDDLPIPGEPFSFGVLEMAQAVGDFQSLDRASRRVLHVHLEGRAPALLQRTLATLV